MFIKMRVTAMMNAGPLASIYLTEAGDLFDLLFGGVPVYRDGRIVSIVEGIEECQDGDPGDSNQLDLVMAESWCLQHLGCKIRSEFRRIPELRGNSGEFDRNVVTIQR